MIKNDEKWYALKVRPRHEKAVFEKLSDKHQVFLPELKKKSQWSDRVKTLNVPMFPGYLFIKINLDKKYYVLNEKGVSAFVEFGKKPAVIRDEEIDSIAIMMNNTESLQIDNGYQFEEGEEVKINRGIFAGVRGRVKKIKNHLRLYVLIEQLGKVVSIEIEKDTLESINSISC